MLGGLAAPVELLDVARRELDRGDLLGAEAEPRLRGDRRNRYTLRRFAVEPLRLSTEPVPAPRVNPVDDRPHRRLQGGIAALGRAGQRFRAPGGVQTGIVDPLHSIIFSIGTTR